jgi:hypothetical protein
MRDLVKCTKCGVEMANASHDTLCSRCRKIEFEKYRYPGRNHGVKYKISSTQKTLFSHTKDMIGINGKFGTYIFPYMKIYKLSIDGNPHIAKELSWKIRKDFDMHNNCWYWESSHGTHDGWHLYIESSSLEKLTEFKNIIKHKYYIEEKDLSIYDGDNLDPFFTIHSIFSYNDRNEIKMGLPQWTSINNLLYEFGKPLKDLGKSESEKYHDEY